MADPTLPLDETQLIDCSHPIEDGMITYKGLPAPIICDWLAREQAPALYGPGSEFQIAKIEMVANTGTYLDAPSHAWAHGADVSELTLAQLAGLPGIVVRVPFTQTTQIDHTWFASLDRVGLQGAAVLVHTGWDVHWRTDAYFEGHPALTESAARFLLDAGVRLVGIDSHNIDHTGGDTPGLRPRPVHRTLLGAGVLIVEHMTNLATLPDDGFRFFAVPPKVAGAGTFPVRAFAITNPSVRSP
jgi:kynurenine formamidase